MTDATADPQPGPRAAVPERTDVLVVGGGPAGAATSYWLARAGRHVTCVERKTFPRDKTCGDGLTPRAVKQLADMGLYDALLPYHRYTGLRALAHGVTVELQWPQHPVYPDHGFVVRRRDLDQLVFQHAADAGAHCHQGTEAVAPIVQNGLVTGAVVKDKASGTTREIRARYVVVADGANSRFGRALGTARTASTPRAWPSAPTTRARATTTRGSRARSTCGTATATRCPGYGWIFPVGDGTVNVGIGLLSTFRDFKSVNTTHLLTRLRTPGGRATGRSTPTTR
jgi:geranylgeranyl reductase family protein